MFEQRNQSQSMNCKNDCKSVLYTLVFLPFFSLQQYYEMEKYSMFFIKFQNI